ncbi:hypothetical protein CKA32_001706 [Geitlerinema sp. FC II]|nr:hypothetical protein CKA32_001706 [Geitlerinema sp. FC II]
MTAKQRLRFSSWFFYSLPHISNQGAIALKNKLNTKLIVKFFTI